jgi:hypothetical protein
MLHTQACTHYITPAEDTDSQRVLWSACFVMGWLCGYTIYYRSSILERPVINVGLVRLMLERNRKCFTPGMRRNHKRATMRVHVAVWLLSEPRQTEQTPSAHRSFARHVEGWWNELSEAFERTPMDDEISSYRRRPTDRR